MNNMFPFMEKGGDKYTHVYIYLYRLFLKVFLRNC